MAELGQGAKHFRPDLRGGKTRRIGIFASQEAENMPRKYQQGKLEIRKDVARPYYFVRVTEPTITKGGVRSKRRTGKPIGFVDQITKRQAMDLRAKLLERVNAPRMLAQSQLYFKDVAERFIEVRCPQLGVAVQGRYPCQLRKHLIPAFGSMRLAEIDKLSVAQFCQKKKEAGLSAWTVTGLKGVLSAVFTTAKDWRLFEGDNPCVGVRVKKRAAREKRLLSVVELGRILAALDERERFIVQILFGLGLRISECLGLKWSDIDFDAEALSVVRRWYRGDISEEETKSEAGTRALQMGSVLTGEFKRRYPGPGKRSQFIFLGEDSKVPPDDRDLLREYFRPIVKRLGLYYKGFGWHAFRRSNVTMRQTVGGATPLEAMRAAGHNSLEMTALYTLPDRQRERNQVDAMFEALIPANLPKC